MRKALLFVILTGLVAGAFAVACSEDPPSDGRINLPPREDAKDSGTDTATAAASCTDLTRLWGSAPSRFARASPGWRFATGPA